MAFLLQLPAHAEDRTNGDQEQAMVDLYFKACLENHGNYDAVLAMAKASGFEEIDLSHVPKRMEGWERRARKDVAWKINDFVLYVAPGAFPGSTQPPADVCSIQAFDLDRSKIVGRLKENRRLTDMGTGKTGGNLLIVDLATPNAAQVMVMDLKPRSQEIGNGHHRVVLIEHYQQPGT
jgi:hypothetical protein